MSKLYKRTIGKWRKSETDLHPPPSGYEDYRIALQQYLIAQGTRGLTQGQLTSKFSNWADAPSIRHELEILRLEGKAQLFRVPSRAGRLIDHWRVTSKIMED